jgi:hypothetical protein
MTQQVQIYTRLSANEFDMPEVLSHQFLCQWIPVCMHCTKKNSNNNNNNHNKKKKKTSTAK